MADVLQMLVAPKLVLQVNGAEYEIAFPLSAVAKAEEKTGKILRTPGAWYTVSADDVPALLEAGLSKHHPEITPEQIAEICDCLTPESLADVITALGALAFPRWTAQFEANMAKLKDKAAGPKDQSADAL